MDKLKEAQEPTVKGTGRYWFSLLNVHRYLIGTKQESGQRIGETVTNARHRFRIVNTTDIETDMDVVVESVCRHEWNPAVFDEEIFDAERVCIAHAASELALASHE